MNRHAQAYPVFIRIRRTKGKTLFIMTFLPLEKSKLRNQINLEVCHPQKKQESSVTFRTFSK